MLEKVGVWEISYTIRDAKGNHSQLLIYYPKFKDTSGAAVTVETVDDPEYFAWVMAGLLDQLVTGQIVRINVGTTVWDGTFPSEADANLKTSPAVLSDVQEGVTLIFRTAGGDVFQHRIPTIDETKLRVSGELNTGDTDAASWLAMMTIPEDAEIGGDWTVGASDARGVDLVTFEKSIQSFTGRRRGN